jgi:saccharopine dehydrogenase-like NADP-dependent oxidoreductase
MVVIAVVGGTGNVGRTIVDALKEDGKHEVIVLTRKVSNCAGTDHTRDLDTNTWQAPEGVTSVPTFAVDYNNVDQLTKTLDANNVHTIISTIVMIYPIAAQSELDLVAAAAKSYSTKRFVASNWGLATPNDE